MTSNKTLRLMSFTVEQSRDEIINSILNQSKSKTAWTFSKQKRFQNLKTEPNNSIANKSMNQPTSFVPKNHSYGFGKSKRNLFTQVSETPFCWKYNPEQPNTKGKNITLPIGRDRCISGSYISKEKLQIPGPANYQVKSLQKPIKYTMRPKTGHQRTYFIENKQAKQIPGPGKYNEDIQDIARKSFTSKFRGSSLGISGIRSKSNRFKTQPGKQSFISTNLYEKLKTSWQRGCPIGSQKRLSFIQTTAKLHDSPGPGKYELPSQFGHYKKIQSNQFRRTRQTKCS